MRGLILPNRHLEGNSKHPRWMAFRKTIKRVHEGPPCYPRDIYRDPKIGLTKNTVKHNLNLGVHLEIFRQLDDGRYAWIDYDASSETSIIDEKVMAAFSELEVGYSVVSLIQISNITGLPPKSIEEPAFRLKSNYDLEIDEKPIGRSISDISIAR